MDDPHIEILHAAKGQPTEDTFPHLTKALVMRLEKVFPDRCPSVATEQRMIWFRCGQVDVVRHLRREYERQREERTQE